MHKDENRNMPEALDDLELEKAVGGMDNDIYLDEDRPPLGWSVTCCDCGKVFTVSKGACPSCGSVHVWMRY